LCIGDGNNRLNNLAWGTRFENMDDRTRLGEHNPPRGTRNHRAVLSEEKVVKIRELKAGGKSFAQIGKIMGVSRGAVGKVLMGRTWRWVS